MVLRKEVLQRVVILPLQVANSTPLNHPPQVRMQNFTLFDQPKQNKTENIFRTKFFFLLELRQSNVRAT